EVECDFAVIEGSLEASLVSKEMATVGPSASINGDVIYNVLELDRGAIITGRLFSIRSTTADSSSSSCSVPWGGVVPRPLAREGEEAKQLRLERELRLAMAEDGAGPDTIGGGSVRGDGRSIPK
ncbi:unnamed protein product, partial [Ectocarpus sp. 13 AM-2016]